MLELAEGPSVKLVQHREGVVVVGGGPHGDLHLERLHQFAEGSDEGDVEGVGVCCQGVAEGDGGACLAEGLRGGTWPPGVRSRQGRCRALVGGRLQAGELFFHHQKIEIFP